MNDLRCQFFELGEARLKWTRKGDHVWRVDSVIGQRYPYRCTVVLSRIGSFI